VLNLSAMQHDSLFDSTENQALLVVCARKTIRNTGIAAIIWGIINLALGCAIIQVNILNVGVIGLGLLMLGTGIAALTKPSLHSLLAAAVVSALLLIWNVSVAVWNAMAGHGGFAGGILLPLVAAIVFFQQYFKLEHLKEAVSTMNRATLKEASGLCKQLFRSKLKESPDIAQATSRKCRLRLMSGAVFCVQRNFARAFYMDRLQLQTCIPDLNRKRLRVVVRHPLGKLKYAFDKKNSEKIKNWLNAPAPQAS
jgi:hypothetical protein